MNLRGHFERRRPHHSDGHALDTCDHTCCSNISRVLNKEKRIQNGITKTKLFQSRVSSILRKCLIGTEWSTEDLNEQLTELYIYILRMRQERS
jgi:hypothetical protein